MLHSLGKEEERRVLVRRLLYTDRDLYRLGKLVGIAWFDKFDVKFAKDTYAYFSDGERAEALNSVVRAPGEDSFVKAINTVYGEKPGYLLIERFAGSHYCFDKKSGVTRADVSNRTAEETTGALKDTAGRGFYFLKALIALYEEDKWDKAYQGAAWADVLAKIRELGGAYPSPRDLSILKSYGIYYRTGSRRYPTHTIPEEMMPTVEKTLEMWKNEVGTR